MREREGGRERKREREKREPLHVLLKRYSCSFFVLECLLLGFFFWPAARRHAAFMHSERKGFRQRHYVPFVERLQGKKGGGKKRRGKGEKRRRFGKRVQAATLGLRWSFVHRMQKKKRVKGSGCITS